MICLHGSHRNARLSCFMGAQHIGQWGVITTDAFGGFLSILPEQSSGGLANCIDHAIVPPVALRRNK